MIIPAAAATLLLAAGETPTPPATPEEFTIYTVTPGISGFIAFFVLALVGWLLFRSLVRHIRKVDMNAAGRERAEQESGADPEQADGGATAGGAGDPATGPVVDPQTTGPDTGPSEPR